MSSDEEALADDVEQALLDKPTERCLRCGGTSFVDVPKPLGFGFTTAPCPVCTPYGPFGMVPAVVAIETSLKDELGEKEKALRAKVHASAAALAWILDDAPLTCSQCKGTGKWVNPSHPKDTRICYGCAGRGVLQ